MAKTKKSVIPEGYDDKTYSLEDFQRAAIDAAVNNARTRTTGHPQPSWWNEEVHGDYNGCIGTATDNFGDDSCEIGNQTFLKNYKDKGFRRLDAGEKPAIGDIVQYVYNKTDPQHSVLITGFDENNFPITSYDNGHGVIKTNNTMHHTLDNPSYTANYFRFVGTPAQQAEIEAHNAAVMDRRRQAAAGVQPLQPQVQQATPVQASDVLSRMAEDGVRRRKL